MLLNALLQVSIIKLALVNAQQQQCGFTEWPTDVVRMVVGKVTRLEVKHNCTNHALVYAQYDWKMFKLYEQYNGMGVFGTLMVPDLEGAFDFELVLMDGGVNVAETTLKFDITRSLRNQLVIMSEGSKCKFKQVPKTVTVLPGGFGKFEIPLTCKPNSEEDEVIAYYAQGAFEVYMGDIVDNEYVCVMVLSDRVEAAEVELRLVSKGMLQDYVSLTVINKEHDFSDSKTV